MPWGCECRLPFPPSSATTVVVTARESGYQSLEPVDILKPLIRTPPISTTAAFSRISRSLQGRKEERKKERKKERKRPLPPTKRPTASRPTRARCGTPHVRPRLYKIEFLNTCAVKPNATHHHAEGLFCLEIAGTRTYFFFFSNGRS